MTSEISNNYETHPIRGSINKKDMRLEEIGISRLKVSLPLIIVVLFFFSGACGLICEVVWMRMLTLVFGATAFATSTILASFFAGLALGSFYFGKVIDRGRNPLKTYALLEAGIGVFAFLMPLIFSGLETLYVGISQHFNISFYLFSLIRFILSFLVLLIPATLMGGTLPVISKFIVRRPERLGWNIGKLYSINTFGAVVGCFSAGFLLIVILGVKESAYLAGVINLLIAGTVFALNWGLRTSATVASNQTKSKKEQAENIIGAYNSKIARLALWVAGVSGFCALAYEVFFTRALVFLLDNTTHAFTTMLVTFLVGIATGSFIIARFVDTIRKPLALLGLIEVLIGLFAILSLPVFGALGAAIENVAVSVDGNVTYWQWTGMRFTRSLSTMLVPTFLMGMTFPLVSKIYAKNLKMVGNAIGNVFSVNTIGGVFGSIIAGFVLVPLIGVHQGIILIASINVVIGGILILYDPLMEYKSKLKAMVPLGLSFTIVAVIFLTVGEFTLTSGAERMRTAEILYYKEGIGATVKVYKDELGDKALSIDGFRVAGTSRELQDIQKALGHLPLLMSKATSPSVNIIGFGSGSTSWAVTQYAVKEVDCVELVPAVADAARWFPEINHGVLNTPDFNLIIGDGRNYSLMATKKYDVISIDATSPKSAGNGSLYTLEFYELLENSLKKDGLVAQWLPFHLMSAEEVKMIAQTFQVVFPHSTLWFTPARMYAVLIGTQEKLEIDFQALSDKLEMKNIKQDLQTVNVTDPFDILNCFIM
ncbi:fused MFS/spermidine synthase, partial [Chloroflexota bacterium]